MWVEKFVIAVGVVFAGLLLYAVVWGLTRAKDRIQAATACLLLCVLGYAAIAAPFNSQVGVARIVSLASGAYAIFLSVVMSALAVLHKRWAWRASIAAFVVQIGLTAIASPVLIQSGRTGLFAMCFGFLLGAVGLWACLHKGSRELVASDGKSAA